MSFFKSAGAPSAKFPTVGTKVGGRIIEILPERQARQYKPFGSTAPDAPKTFPDGSPVMELPIIVQLDPGFTKERESDTGRRGFYVQKGSGQYKALAEAVRRTGIEPQVGGYLEIEFVDSIQGRGSQPRKIYVVNRLEAPSPAEGFYEEAEDEAAALIVPAQPAAPVRAPRQRPVARAAATPPSGNGAI